MPLTGREGIAILESGFLRCTVCIFRARGSGPRLCRGPRGHRALVSPGCGGAASHRCPKRRHARPRFHELPACRRGFAAGTQFCPVDASRLQPPPRRGLGAPARPRRKCPRCRRAFEAGMRFCPMDAEELVPLGHGTPRTPTARPRRDLRRPPRRGQRQDLSAVRVEVRSRGRLLRPRRLRARHRQLARRSPPRRTKSVVRGAAPRWRPLREGGHEHRGDRGRAPGAHERPLSGDGARSRPRVPGTACRSRA